MTPPDRDIPDHEAADILAAEFVLGTLPLEAREAAATRIRRDAHFALAVARWEHRLAPLNAGYEDVPAPDLLPKIEARLFGAAPKGNPESLHSGRAGLVGLLLPQRLGWRCWLICRPHRNPFAR
ncbi:hypothetical protein [Pseudorhodobacter sp.]|uniref:hypothetical protein n=1 Tax=Pseudorhodobacter sp. TaxID=1934400 RepID=UPI002B000674|nr:hypothetical protein [Pseudorhodobacter sp.]